MPARTEVETGATLAWIAEIDAAGHAMERPFMRLYVHGRDEAEAMDAARRVADADGESEVVRRVVQLQPILDRIADEVTSGKPYTISWKHEGRAGPVVITDLDASRAEFGEGVAHVVPFGTEPKCDTVLPWMSRAEARRLATYLGLKLEEW